MLPILLIAQNYYTSTCVFGGTPTVAGSSTLNTNNWIQLNLVVILASFAICGILYALSSLFSVTMREKMRGAAKYEAFQGLICTGIILALIGFSEVSCQVGENMVASSVPIIHISYQDPMQFSEAYLGNLMFTQGLGLFTSIYSESVLLTITGGMSSLLEDMLKELTLTLISLDFSPNLISIFYGFSGAISATYLPLMVVCFGIIFMIYLLLPLIEAIALTVMVPLALVMRSIPFAGPKLRETSDTVLAIAIGFYFILPLAILSNSYIVTWMYTPCTSGGSSFCNPYSQFTAPYQLESVQTSSFFNEQPQAIAPKTTPLGGFTVPFNFLSSAAASQGGISGAIGYMLNTLYGLPQLLIQMSLGVAQYIFQGIVLIGIDLAITLAFAQGLTKGLNSVGKIIGVGPFWGNI